MTGLFLSDCVGSRDGWGINKCLAKLSRTSPFEFWLCYASNYICYREKNQVEWSRVFCFFTECCDGLPLWDSLGVYVYCTLTSSGKQMSQMMIVVCTAIRLALKSPAALVGKQSHCRWCSMSWVSGWAGLGRVTSGGRCDQHWVRSRKSSWTHRFFFFFFLTQSRRSPRNDTNVHILSVEFRSESMFNSYCCSCHLHSKHSLIHHWSLHPQYWVWAALFGLLHKNNQLTIPDYFS